MKMDMRFVVDIAGKEIDIGAGEASSAVCAKTKIDRDEGKLVREIKDILDGLIHYCIDFSIDGLRAMVLQTSGILLNEGAFMTILLAVYFMCIRLEKPSFHDKDDISQNIYCFTII
jgi:hypothetical protein